MVCWEESKKSQRSLQEGGEEEDCILSTTPQSAPISGTPAPYIGQTRPSVSRKRKRKHHLLFVRPEMIRLWFETDGCRWFVHSYKYAWCPDASTFFNILREGQTTPMVSRTRRKKVSFSLDIGGCRGFVHSHVSGSRIWVLSPTSDEKAYYEEEEEGYKDAPQTDQEEYHALWTSNHR